MTQQIFAKPTQSVLDQYAAFRWQIACLEAKLKEIEPIAIAQALDIIGNGKAANGKQIVVDINIIKVSKWFGSLGKTQNVLWIQLFFIPAPGVAPEILPKNTVCVGYLKKQSIANLFNTVQTAMNCGEPALGIFTLGFNKESGAAGSYYTVSFNWRERRADEELQQLELIKAFMESYRARLVDLEGTRELVCVDGWSAEQIQALLLEVKQEVYLEEPPALPERKQRRLSGSR
jgi:hypothetical protein